MQLLDRSTTRRAVKPAHTAADQVERVELVRPPGLVAAELLQKGFHVTPRRVVPQRAIRAVEHPDPVRRDSVLKEEGRDHQTLLLLEVRPQQRQTEPRQAGRPAPRVADEVDELLVRGDEERPAALLAQRHGTVELRTLRAGAVLRCMADTALDEPPESPVLLPNELHPAARLRHPATKNGALTGFEFNCVNNWDAQLGFGVDTTGIWGWGQLGAHNWEFRRI